MLNTLLPLLPGASRHAADAGAHRADPQTGGGFAELMQQAGWLAAAAPDPGSAAAVLDDAAGLAAAGPRAPARSAMLPVVHATNDAAIETWAALRIAVAVPRTDPARPGLAGQVTAADTTALPTDAPTGLCSRTALPAATRADDAGETAADRASFDLSSPILARDADAAIAPVAVAAAAAAVAPAVAPAKSLPEVAPQAAPAPAAAPLPIWLQGQSLVTGWRPALRPPAPQATTLDPAAAPIPAATRITAPADAPAAPSRAAAAPVPAATHITAPAAPQATTLDPAAAPVPAATRITAPADAPAAPSRAAAAPVPAATRITAPAVAPAAPFGAAASPVPAATRITAPADAPAAPSRAAAVTTRRPAEVVSQLPALPELAPTGPEADARPGDASPVDEAGSQVDGATPPSSGNLAALPGPPAIPVTPAILPAPTPSAGAAGPTGPALTAARQHGAAGLRPVAPSIDSAGPSAQRVIAALPARPGEAATSAPLANPKLADGEPVTSASGPSPAPPANRPVAESQAAPAAPGGLTADRRQTPTDAAAASVSTPAALPPAGAAPAHRATPDTSAPGPVPTAPPAGRAVPARAAETRESNAQVEPARPTDTTPTAPVLPPLAAASAPAGPLHAGPAAPASPAMADAQIQARLDSPGFGPALGAQISLFVRDGVQTARLQLNPGEMGPITVQIAVDGNAARVDFQADLAGTRAIIEASLPALAGALQDAGMTLAGGGVSQQAFGQHQPPHQPPDQPPHQPPRQPPADAPLHRGPADDASRGATTPSAAPARTRGLVDLVA